MFLGEFTHTLDDKNRITVPVKFRTFLSEGQDREGFFMIVSPNPEERSLRMYTMSAWRRVSEQLRKDADGSEDPARTLRFFAARGEFSPMDSQSRLVIPQKLLDFAGLSKEVVLVGNFEWIEVWNIEDYHEEAEKLSQAPVDRKRALWPAEKKNL